MLPLPVERLAFADEVAGSLQARFQCGWLEGLQHQLADQCIERRRLERLTDRLTVVARHAAAGIPRQRSVVVILRHHAQAAAAADNQPGQQRLSGARHAGIRRFVRAQLHLIALILLPADIGRHAVRKKYFGILDAEGTTTCAGAARLLSSAVDRPTTIHIDAGVNRIGEQIVQRDAVDTAPLELTLARTATHPHRHADVVVDQIAHHLADRAKADEQIEHQADRGLRLFVGIERDLARRAMHIAHRHGFAELAASRLCSSPLQHSRLQDVKLRLRHRPLQPEQQTIVVSRRIVDAVGIRNQRVEQRTDLQQLMPISARTRQARHLHAQHQPDVPKPDLRHQPLEAEPALD